MSQATVHELLDRVKKLPEEDRVLFDDLLAREEEREWREEVCRVRRAAREKGIDQDAIDQAVHAVRYGG